MIQKAIATALLSVALAGFPFAAPVNGKCPVEGKDVAGKKSSSVTVTFCCKKCKAKFDKEPASYLVELSEAKEGFCLFSHKRADKEVTSTLEVGTCCGDCKEKFDAAPRKFLSKLK